MAAEPAATVPPGGKKPKGKGLSLRNPWTWVIIGGIALAGGAFILWRNHQAAAAASSTGSTGSTDTTGTDDSAALGTLQDEIGNLQSAGAGTVGVTGATGTDTSSNSGSTTAATGPSTGDTTSSGSSGTSSSNGSSGSSSPGGGGTTTTTAAPTVSNGHVVSVSNNRATIAWTGTGATQWRVTRTIPGSTKTQVNVVGVPQAVYTGLPAGHNFEVTVQPLVNGQPAGQSGVIHFQTT